MQCNVWFVYYENADLKCRINSQRNHWIPYQSMLNDVWNTNLSLIASQTQTMMRHGTAFSQVNVPKQIQHIEALGTFPIIMKHHHEIWYLLQAQRVLFSRPCFPDWFNQTTYWFRFLICSPPLIKRFTSEYLPVRGGAALRTNVSCRTAQTLLGRRWNCRVPHLATTGWLAGC